jgi:hypothetical protein
MWCSDPDGSSAATVVAVAAGDRNRGYCYWLPGAGAGIGTSPS